jgi:hypothetical protein
MYAPITPLIAPEAPTIGMALPGFTRVWVAAATNPVSR